MPDNILSIGQPAKVLKHGYCFHFGQTGQIINLRMREDQIVAVEIGFDKIPEHMTGAYRGWLYRYWCPVLSGEIESGVFKYFELVKEQSS